MRSLAVLVVFGAFGGCGTDTAGTTEDLSPRTYEFGPFSIAAGEEVTDQCVQITLHNDTDLYVNQVELTTGTGFHHSNWFFVPEHVFAGDDGTYTCNDRDFNEPVAAIKGGVLFAQSTQSAHEIQAFPAGVAIKVPAHSKIVSQIHLLNPTDGVLTLAPTIRLVPIAAADVTTRLAGISFEDHALGLPPNARSRFSVECDLLPQWQTLYSLGNVTSPMPDFKVFYGLAHYHRMGTAMKVEAVKPEGTATTIFSTETKIGDALGGPIDPAFDMTGYTKIRFSCEYFNPTSATVGWGNGDQEMCVFLAFSDSGYNWGGGVVSDEPPGTPVDDQGVASFTFPSCTVFANDASR